MALFPTGATVRGRVLASFPSTVEGTGGIGVSKQNGVWTIEPSWDDLTVETTLADASERELWIYNPDTDVYTRLSVQYLLDNLPTGPAGATGSTGAPSGVQFTYSTTTTDSDPGSGVFRLNHATIASATAAYIDNNDAGGSSVTSWLDSFDDSTTTAKGTLVIRGVTTQSAWAVFAVTGAVVDGTGYRKLTISCLASGGVWTNAETFAFAFSRTGDKGSDGAGVGDVVGPAAAVAGEIVLFDLTTGKLIKRASLTGLVKATSGVASAASAGTDYVAPGGALGTPSSGTLTNCTGLPVAGITASTSTALGVGSLELGHASANTLTASSGVLSIEGKTVSTLSTAQQWTAQQRVSSSSLTDNSAPNLSTTQLFIATVNGSAFDVVNYSAAPSDKTVICIRFEHHASTGGYGVNLGSKYKATGWTPSSANSKIDETFWRYNSTADVLELIGYRNDVQT